MTVSALKEKLVLQAIQVLRELNAKHYEDSSKKKPLLQDEETLFLQVMLKKIPKSKLTKMIKVNLPHSLVKDSDEVCLITGDLDKNNRKAQIEPDVLHYKALLDKHGVTHISEVMTLRQLRTEYKPYEAKQKLLAAYDIFLTDNKISECLPKVLGKHFFKKRKFPVQINMKTSNLKQQIEKALSTKVFYITGQGNACTSEVAYLDMADTEILENIMAMAEALSENVPGSWCNIMGIYLKAAKSKAIPLYVSYENPNSVQLPEAEEEGEVLIDELSTIPSVRVKVYKDGRVQTVRIDDVMETSLDKTDENDAEKISVDSELQDLKNECSEMEKFETKTTKQVTSKKETSFANKKKENTKQEPISPNHSEEKEVKSEEETKSMKQKKKNTKQKPTYSDHSLQQTTQEVKSERETKSKKQKKKNMKHEPISSDLSLQQIEPSEKIIKKTALKRKRGSAIVDSERAINGGGTPMQPTKKRKVEGINMKRYQAMKESKKNKKKKNQSRKKQRI